MEVGFDMPIGHKKIKAINLPYPNDDLIKGTQCKVIGWGNTKNADESTNIIRGVTLPYIETEECNEMYREFGSLTPRMICAGYVEGGKDSCQGDSGGSLTVNGTIYGVVSWGNGKS